MSNRVYYNLQNLNRLELSDGRSSGYADLFFCKADLANSPKVEGREKIYPAEFVRKVDELVRLIEELKKMKQQVRFVFDRDDGGDELSHPLPEDRE